MTLLKLRKLRQFSLGQVHFGGKTSYEMSSLFQGFLETTQISE